MGKTKRWMNESSGVIVSVINLSDKHLADIFLSVANQMRKNFYSCKIATEFYIQNLRNSAISFKEPAHYYKLRM